MAQMKKIEVGSIKVGTCFSAPLFFEDGVNMFLSDNKKATQYHVDALKKWPVPFLLTTGEEIDEPVEEKNAAVDDVEELEEIDGELEEL